VHPSALHPSFGTQHTQQHRPRVASQGIKGGRNRGPAAASCNRGVCRAGISRRPGAQQVDGIPALNPAALADGTLPNLRPGQVQRVQGLTSSSASPSSHSGRRATPSQAPQRIVQVRCLGSRGLFAAPPRHNC